MFHELNFCFVSGLFIRVYHWCALHLLAWQVRVIVDDSSHCCCIVLMSFECQMIHFVCWFSQVQKQTQASQWRLQPQWWNESWRGLRQEQFEPCRITRRLVTFAIFSLSSGISQPSKMRMETCECVLTLHPKTLLFTQNNKQINIKAYIIINE